jgi:arsenate reductase-like glutaredoxin family protein
MSALNQNQLLKIAECSQKSALIEWLRENGIKYTLSRKGRVISTLEQINSALSDEGRQEVIEFGQE